MCVCVCVCVCVIGVMDVINEAVDVCVEKCVCGRESKKEMR